MVAVDREKVAVGSVELGMLVLSDQKCAASTGTVTQSQTVPSTLCFSRTSLHWLTETGLTSFSLQKIK